MVKVLLSGAHHCINPAESQRYDLSQAGYVPVILSHSGKKHLYRFEDISKMFHGESVAPLLTSDSIFFELHENAWADKFFNTFVHNDGFEGELNAYHEIWNARNGRCYRFSRSHDYIQSIFTSENWDVFHIHRMLNHSIVCEEKENILFAINRMGKTLCIRLPEYHDIVFIEEERERAIVHLHYMDDQYAKLCFDVNGRVMMIEACAQPKIDFGIGKPMGDMPEILGFYQAAQYKDLCFCSFYFWEELPDCFGTVVFPKECWHEDFLLRLKRRIVHEHPSAFERQAGFRFIDLA